MSNESPTQPTLRQKIAVYLDDIETIPGRIINLLIAGLVLVSLAIFVAETYGLPPEIRSLLSRIDQGIVVIFSLEYLLRFWCAERKLEYFFSLYALIDLATILPFILGLTDLRFIRIFRWFRILRLIRFFQGGALFGRMSSEDNLIFKRIIFTLIAIVFVYSGLIYQVEHPINPEVFNTFLDAVYFSVVTMTTVGFGDVTPHSQLGRLLTVLMILTGITLIPWQVGDLIKRFVQSNNRVKVLCSGCGLDLHDNDARHCKACGTRLVRIELSGKAVQVSTASKLLASRMAQHLKPRPPDSET